MRQVWLSVNARFSADTHTPRQVSAGAGAQKENLNTRAPLPALPVFVWQVQWQMGTPKKTKCGEHYNLDSKPKPRSWFHDSETVILFNFIESIPALQLTVISICINVSISLLIIRLRVQNPKIFGLQWYKTEKNSLTWRSCSVVIVYLSVIHQLLSIPWIVFR